MIQTHTHTDLLGDIINNDYPMSSSVVAGSDGSKPLLTCCVPLMDPNTQTSHDVVSSLTARPHTAHVQHPNSYDLQLHRLPVHVDGPDLKVHSDGGDVAFCVGVVLSQWDSRTFIVLL